MHKPIVINQLSLILPHKTCFEDFNVTIPYGAKIAITGSNGLGKSTLLKAILGQNTPADGDILTPKDISIGYVEQISGKFADLSGGENFNKQLTSALLNNPDILLLDEPTNHLDIYNRKSLMNMLDRFPGTLIIVSHDEELLRRNTHTIWNIHDGIVEIFTGSYDDYKTKNDIYRQQLEGQLNTLHKEKKNIHKNLMKEQERSAKSKKHGEKQKAQGRWAPIVAGGKERAAQVTSGKKLDNISTDRDSINERLRSTRLPEVIVPTFSIPAQETSYNVLFISGASAGYKDKPVLSDINLSLSARGKTAILGRNASGKTTLLRAILRNPEIITDGLWELPKQEEIGYLDQHYRILDNTKTVIEYISSLVPGKTHAEIRKQLNDFLFRKNEEINAPIALLSGGERARLSLAAISCKTPKLLILDEITNNIDLQTKEHITQVLSGYPGTMLVVSHEEEFIKKLGIQNIYLTEGGTLLRQ